MDVYVSMDHTRVNGIHKLVDLTSQIIMMSAVMMSAVAMSGLSQTELHCVTFSHHKIVLELDLGKRAEWDYTSPE